MVTVLAKLRTKPYPSAKKVTQKKVQFQQITENVLRTNRCGEM